MLDLEPNRRVPELGVATVDGFLRGPLVFVRTDGPDFASLADDDVRALLWRFRDATRPVAHRTRAGAHG
jgi:hypothetical protein